MHSFLSNFTSHGLHRFKHFKQYKQAFKMKFTHPALLALLSTATAIPFFQGFHRSLEEGLLPREDPHPITPKDFPTPTIPLGTDFGGHGHHTPTETGKTPHYGGHGTGKPSGAVKHHSTGGHHPTDRHPRPTPSKSKGKSRDLPRLFPTFTPPSWGSWPTGWNPGNNGGGFPPGGAPTGWFPKVGKHPHYSVPCPTGTGWPLSFPTGGPPFSFPTGAPPSPIAAA
jgi:hypothetical protein